MNKYEQLQSILNKCIEKWRLKWTWAEEARIKDWTVRIKWAKRPLMSFNDLFSVDSWLMKFVEWKWVDHEWCRNPVEERWGGIWWESYYWTSTDSYDRKRFHLLEMSDLTAEDKVFYFLENIIDG